MKRLSLLLMSVVLLFGMTQCKKKVEPIAGETVHITLDVDSGGKHEVYPSTGAVVYTAGDVIYVGNGGKYVGSLTYANGAFSGTLTGVVTTDYLHFYFVSGLTPSDTPSAGSTTSFTVNISDQSSALPVLSYGKSNIIYTSGTTAYSSILENKCGLVKFVPATATSSTVMVSGMNTVAMVNFASPGITATGTTGTVTLYPESTTAKWAILLPQSAVTNPTVTISGYTCTANVPAVTNNMYYTSGVSISMTYNGVISGLFTVNSSGTKVYFASGNVEHVSSTYRFASTQWTDHSGTLTEDVYYFNKGLASTAVTGLNSANYLGRNDWRMLTNTEWEYVFNTRTTVDGTAGQNHNWKWITLTDVTQSGNSNNSMTGALLFPDGYGDVTGVSTSMTSSALATYEAAGCVFLPAAGYGFVYEDKSHTYDINLSSCGNMGAYATDWDSYEPHGLFYPNSAGSYTQGGNEHIRWGAMRLVVTAE